MINSVQLLLSTATKVDNNTPKANGSEKSENSFEKELNKELGLLSDEATKSVDETDLETKQEAEIEDEQPTTEDCEISEQVNELALQNKILSLSLSQNTPEQASTSNESEPQSESPLASKATIVSLSELISNKGLTTPKEESKEATSVINEPALTDLVSAKKDDNNNLIDSLDIKNKIFDSKLQKLINSHKNGEVNEQKLTDVKPKVEASKLQLTKTEETKTDLHNEKIVNDSSKELLSKLVKTEEAVGNQVENSGLLNNLMPNKITNSFENTLLQSEQVSEQQPNAELKSGESIMNQMTESISYGKLANGEYIHVKLKPDYLGAMSINIQKTESGSVLNIQVENQTVKRMLSEKMDDLMTVLSDKFVAIDKVQITTEHQSGNSNLNQQLNQQGFANSQQHDQQQHEAKKNYMNLDAVPSNQQSEQQNDIKVSIYV